MRRPNSARAAAAAAGAGQRVDVVPIEHAVPNADETPAADAVPPAAGNESRDGARGGFRDRGAMAPAEEPAAIAEPDRDSWESAEQADS
ncbi:MAG TPA: hypothetical protein VG267_06960 [Terracidiphilus sp.]|nr:hypothetical protein [Terracidiphilus sp.]